MTLRRASKFSKGFYSCSMCDLQMKPQDAKLYYKTHIHDWQEYLEEQCFKAVHCPVCGKKLRSRPRNSAFHKEILARKLNQPFWRY